MQVIPDIYKEVHKSEACLSNFLNARNEYSNSNFKGKTNLLPMTMSVVD